MTERGRGRGREISYVKGEILWGKGEGEVMLRENFCYFLFIHKQRGREGGRKVISGERERERERKKKRSIKLIRKILPKYRHRVRKVIIYKKK